MSESDKKSKKDVLFKVWIQASPERVYRALTQAEDLARWFVDQAEADPHVGGRLKLTWTGIGSGEYVFLKLVLGREVAISWEKGSKIMFRLSPHNAGTFIELTLVAVPFADKELDCYTAMVAGWAANLCKLKCVVEKGWDLRLGQPTGSLIA
jgi:uncharacterized protein YndB with AHSA1/START domain